MDIWLDWVWCDFSFSPLFPCFGAQTVFTERRDVNICFSHFLFFFYSSSLFQLQLHLWMCFHFSNHFAAAIFDGQHMRARALWWSTDGCQRLRGSFFFAYRRSFVFRHKAPDRRIRRTMMMVMMIRFTFHTYYGYHLQTLAWFVSGKDERSRAFGFRMSIKGYSFHSI